MDSGRPVDSGRPLRVIWLSARAGPGRASWPARYGRSVSVSAPTRGEAPVRTLIVSLVPLGSAMALIGLATAFTTPFLSLYLTGTLHADPVHTAIFLFGTPLSTVVVATLLGRLSDRAPGRRRQLLAWAAAAGCLGYLVFALVRQYWLLLAVSMTLVAISGALMPQIFAYARQILDASGSTRAPMAMTTLRMLLSAAWVAGPPVAAILLQTVGFGGLFLATAVGFALVFGVVVFWLRDSSPPTPPAQVTPTGPMAGRVRSWRPARPGPASLTMVAFVLLQSAAGLGMLALPLLLSVELHGRVKDAGAVLGLCAALEIPLMLLFGALASVWPLRRLVLVGAGFGAGYYVLVAMAGSVWQVAAAQLLNAAFISAVTGLGISYFQDLLPGYPGRATTMFTNCNRISAMLTGPIFGVVLHVGYRLAYVLGAVLCVAGLIMLAVLQRTTGTAENRHHRVGTG